MSLTVIGGWLSGEVFDLSLGEAWRHVLKRRAEAARHILQDELAHAEINIADTMDKDEAASMVFGYVESARLGTARRNLRMLARILAGSLKSPPIYAGEFLRWSRVLADLSYEEMIVLAKYHQAFQHQPEKDSQFEIFRAVYGELSKQGVFSDEDEMRSVLGALQRTGLILFQPGWDNGIYLVSPQLIKLMTLVDMDKVLAEPDR
jgi:hypothetical protein